MYFEQNKTESKKDYQNLNKKNVNILKSDN